ncbi:MAG: energy-coupling factor ABC transporter permease [Christensenellaceae bacterium]|jgi:cobalt/nickel transport system permease protein|nr:energy-coupling factor ABC transporter permease [Christensenellaceae bacterium]
MHMADALLSPAVGIVMGAVSAGAIAYSVTKVKKDELSEKKIPLMAVAGAMVFAAQMVNFTIPGTGSSGHIGGGILLAGLLGGTPAFLSISAVLIIQCLFFADGGLLALGCNIFNMGVIPCLLIYPLLFKPFLKKNISYGRLSVSSVISVVASLLIGSFAVVLQTLASGITALPFGLFAALMLPIHAVIGLIEGLITAGILCFVYKMRPEILGSARSGEMLKSDVSTKQIIVFLGVAALIIGGVGALFASTNPDGLEWAIAKIVGGEGLQTENAVQNGAGTVQDALAFLPDYGFRNGENETLGTSTAGIIGAVCTFIFAFVTGFIISKAKKARKKTDDGAKNIASENKNSAE